ncbi:MAG TPA: pantoate--beta-alanine ligase [Gemmatimonadaceae bacterium]
MSQGMFVVRSIHAVREAVGAARRAGATIGFVPTMGAFHDGHLSLMRRARAECGFVVVSVFVNPTQFNEAKDFEGYPRDEGRDAAMARGEGVDLLFAPTPEVMYPAGFATMVELSGVTEPLEGAQRGPLHFRGVATVVSKLFNIVQPDVAYFGQKDAQQALVVRRMVQDLDFPVRVAVCPTVREPDGLAMSSRNVRLSPEERGQALALKRGLDAAAAVIASGARDRASVERAGTAAMRAAGVTPEYFAAVDASTLQPAEVVRGELLLAVAARVGPVRLIDNLLLTVPA